MTDRERLLEILDKPIFPHEMVDPLEAVADYLLDNGVTFAKDTNVPSWIPVTERLPEKNTAVIVATDRGDTFQCLYAYDGWDLWEGYIINITHWMPLPEPPKEDGHE